MNLVWTKNAKKDLTEYIRESKLFNVSQYINDLIDYIDTLKTTPRLGRVLFKENNKEIRQLIYKMHRILYYIDENDIFILIITHTHRNTNKMITYLRENLL